MTVDFNCKERCVKELKVEDKWSISYYTINNDRPLKLFRFLAQYIYSKLIFEKWHSEDKRFEYDAYEDN